MDNLKKLVSADEMKTLKEIIKHRYKAYHTFDRDKFPDFDYNTNRSNYEPLRASFEYEFYVIRGLDRSDSNIHIPSTNTFALIFTDSSYVPGKKILNTCRLYATTRPDPMPEPDSSAIAKPQFFPRFNIHWLWFLSFILIGIIGFTVFEIRRQSSKKVIASGLVMYRPYYNQVVPRLVQVEGKVTNADEVWIVVHPQYKGEKFYVQGPVSVNKNGSWSGKIFIGTPYEAPTDLMFEVRAFVNPQGSYNAIEEKGTIVFDSWPEKADLATEPVMVIRKPKTKQ